MGASSSVVSYWASYSLTGNAAGDCALFLLPRSKSGQKEKRIMKAVKAVLKVIWWIIRIPLLPIILGWRWSKGKGSGIGFSTRSGGVEVDSVSAPGLGRFIYFVFYSVILYAVMYALVWVVAIAFAIVASQFTGKSTNDTTPVVEQVVESNNTGTATNNVLLDK